jgi:hypothetical protein
VTTFTRSSDRWKLPTTAAGFLLLVIFGALVLLVPAERQPSDVVKYALLGIGAGLISPTFIVDALRLWRGGSGTPPAGPQA